MKLKRTMGFLLCLVMLLGLLPMGVFAISAGDVAAPDSAAWGTQGNNGWYYMYKLADGTYHEMNFYGSTDEVGWRQNAYASDLSTTVEMFFINQSACFYGENGTRPVYAYKAPATGRIVLTMLTHSTEQMKMQVYVGDKLQKISGKDELTLCTTGIFDGAMTKTELILDVSKDEMVYVEFYSSDMNAQRQAWVGGYEVEYLSVKESVDYTGQTLSPDMNAWGTQGNNGWYYMYKLADGAIHEMPFYTAEDSVAWRQNAYASDLSTTVEMFFINQASFFTGENGTRPVYAFKAPVGGQIKLYFETHGIADMFAQVYVGDKLQTINGSDRVTFTTTGTLPGAMTATELTMNVKKDEMVYIVCGTSGANREGWLKNYQVTYLSTNDEVDYTGVTYAAASSNWGKQDNNGWFYMYDYRGTGKYGLLDYYPADAAIAWQQNAYSFDVNRYVEMLFVQETHFFTGEQGSKVVYGFKAPASGTLDVYFETHGNENITAQAFVEDTLVQINGADTLVFSAGSLVGAFAPNTMTVNMTKGEMLYIVCSSAIRDGWFRNPSATYTHACASNVTETEAVAPTCTTEGNVSYFTCTCGKVYADAACTTEITDTVLPALGHNYVDGSCTLCGATEAVAPTEVTVKVSHTVSFDSDLQMNYRIKLSDILAAVPNYVTDGAYLVVEKDRYPMGGGAKTVETVTLQPDLTTDETRMLFSLPGIQSVEMGSELRAVLHFFDADGKEYYTTVDTYSVLAYAQLCFDYYDPATDATLFTMLIDCLNYGAAAQVAFDRRADEPVNAGLDAYQQYATTELSAELTDVKTVAENDRSITAVSKMGFSVTFADKTELNAKLTIAEGYTKSDITSVKVLNEAGEEVATLTEFTELDDGRLQVTFTGVKSVDMRNMYYFVAYVGDQAASQNVGYSIEAYAKSNVASNDVNAANLAKTCIYYGDSAYAHFNRNNQNKTAWIATIPGDTDANGWSAPIA